MEYSKDPTIARLQRLKRAEAILREEYDKEEHKRPQYEIDLAKYRSEVEAINKKPENEFKKEWELHQQYPPSPNPPNKEHAERRASYRTLEEMTLTERLCKEYMKIVKHRIEAQPKT